MEFYINTSNTPSASYNKKTLFCIGFPYEEEIIPLMEEHDLKYLVLGADHSFTPTNVPVWSKKIKSLLDKGYIVSFEYESNYHNRLENEFPPEIWSSHNFIPVIVIRVKNIESLNGNLTVQIEDTDYGQWGFNYKEITDSNRFISTQEMSINKEVVTVSEKLVAPSPATITTTGYITQVTPPLRLSPKTNAQTLEAYVAVTHVDPNNILSNHPEDFKKPVTIETPPDVKPTPKAKPIVAAKAPKVKKDKE
jgi:hypothetical protein